MKDGKAVALGKMQQTGKIERLVTFLHPTSLCCIKSRHHVLIKEYLFIFCISLFALGKMQQTGKLERLVSFLHPASLYVISKADNMYLSKMFVKLLKATAVPQLKCPTRKIKCFTCCVN